MNHGASLYAADGRRWPENYAECPHGNMVREGCNSHAYRAKSWNITRENAICKRRG